MGFAKTKVVAATKSNTAARIRALAGGLLPCLVILVAAAVAPAGTRVEDRTKLVAFETPDGFLLSEESTAERLVLIGPTMAGVDARIEVWATSKPLTPEELLADALGEQGLRATSAGVEPWDVLAETSLAGAVTFEPTSDGKTVRMGLAVGRFGPRMAVFSAQASPKHFEQLSDTWASWLASAEKAAGDADFHDDELGIALLEVPDWLGLDPGRTEAGERATWTWETREEVGAVIELTKRPRAADFDAAFIEYRKELAELGVIDGFETEKVSLCGVPAHRSVIQFNGSQDPPEFGYAFEVLVQNDDHMLRLRALTREADFHDVQAAFDELLAQLDVVKPVGG